MSTPIALRPDFDAASVRRAAKTSKDAAQSRRLLALAEIYDGGTRTDAARIGGVGLQTVRDWVLAFNTDGPAGLIDGKAPGKPAKLNDDQRQALARLVESGPIPAIHCANVCGTSPGGYSRSSASVWTRPRSAASGEAWLPQAVGSAPALCAERGGHGRF